MHTACISYPTPEEQRAAEFDLWTYMLFDLQSDSNFITLTWVSSLDKSVTLQCKFTCKSSAIVSHKDFQFQVRVWLVAVGRGLTTQ